jgi:cation diffusion facilitator CzcD-associated flavoprotein CzcO
MKPDCRTRRVVIMGAGPGGMCTAIKLKDAGVEDFMILERASGVGGTWYNNTYPGLECDVRSHLYSFSFEPKKDWTRPYPSQPEILEYLQGVATKYGILPQVQFDTQVRSAHWDESTSTWELATDRGSFRAEVVVSAIGMFNVIKWPDIPGRDEFRGTLFHSARWNHEHDLSGADVAVIGSAASAVQLAPEIARDAKRLFLFQRSASWVLPKANTPFTAQEIEHFVSDPDAARLERAKIYAQAEAFLTFSDPEVRRRSEADGLRAIEVVEDPDVRSRLAPSVPWGCHRPLLSDDYYPMFNRPNVELVTEPIERITADSVVTAGGRRLRVDTIVAATGYDVQRFLSAIEVRGRGGRRLEEAWSGGAEAYLGITTSGFPNIFMLYGPNTNNGSILTMLEYQADYIVRQIERMGTEGIAWMDVRRDAMARYNQQVEREMADVEVWQVACHNYYRAPSGRIVTQWPNTMDEYRRRTSTPDADAYETGKIERSRSQNLMLPSS